MDEAKPQQETSELSRAYRESERRYGLGAQGDSRRDAFVLGWMAHAERTAKPPLLTIMIPPARKARRG